MKIKYECLPCLTRETITLACRVSKCKNMQRDIIKYGLKQISDEAFINSPPYVTAQVYRYGKEVSGVSDPFLKEKEEFNDIASKLVIEMNLNEKVKTSDNPFDTAVRLSIAGNIIDFSLNRELEEDGVVDSVNMSLNADIHGSTSTVLYDKAMSAKKILFLADNAGEIVFDKLLVSELPKDKITYVVKGGPIVNDATIDDAVSVGMIDMVKVIDNGAAIQGTILNECSNEFLKEFEEADLIISKGQANYETLSEEKNKEIFFLLRAKCQSIADDIGCKRDNFVILHNVK